MIWVIDDFMPNFAAYKEWASRLKYENKESQGITYKDVLISPNIELTKSLIESALSKRLVTQLAFLRKYIDHQPHTHPAWIHSDVRFGGLATTLFIRPSHSWQDDGMTFWEHKNLGRGLRPQDPPEVCIQADRDTLNVQGNFTPYLTVPFKENRMVVFDACLFHSKQTYTNRGDADHCRLIEVGFFAETPFDIPKVTEVVITEDNSDGKHE